MAKTKRSAARAVRRRRTNWTAVIISAVCAVLVGVIVALGVGSEWFRNPDPLKWFNSWGKGNVVVDEGGKEQQSTLIALSSDGEELHAGHTYAMPRALTVFSTQATASQYVPERELTIQANLNNPYIKGYYDWSVEFVDPDAAWAQGKVASDYVPVTPSEDGSTAQLQFVEAFGEQIKVVAHLRDTLKSGECVLDCLAEKIEKQSVAFGDNYYDFGEDEGYISHEYGVGTVRCEYEVNYIYVYLSSEFVETLSSYLTFSLDDLNLDDYRRLNDFTIQTTYDEDGEKASWFNYNLTYSDIFKGFDNYPTAKKQAIYYAWYHASLDMNGNGVQVEVGLKAIYQGQVILDRGITRYINIELSGKAMGKNVQPDVEFNTNITFG